MARVWTKSLMLKYIVSIVVIVAMFVIPATLSGNSGPTGHVVLTKKADLAVMSTNVVISDDCRLIFTGIVENMGLTTADTVEIICHAGDIRYDEPFVVRRVIGNLDSRQSIDFSLAQKTSCDFDYSEFDCLAECVNC
ncbi:hypothetical protein JW868_00420 [Candidatus Woesearchaeota archaeon]|nr:hypothetical protein [Candidatus Woesearchaeota archaeon]